MSLRTQAFFGFPTKIVLAALPVFGLLAAASYSPGEDKFQPSASLFLGNQTVVQFIADLPKSRSDDAPLHARPCAAVPGALALALAAGMALALRGGIDEDEEGDVLPCHKKEETWHDEVAMKDFTCCFAALSEDDDGWEAATDREYEHAMELQYEQLRDTLQSWDANKFDLLGLAVGKG